MVSGEVPHEFQAEKMGNELGLEGWAGSAEAEGQDEAF